MEKVAAKKQEEEGTYRPPQMTLEQLNQISALHQKVMNVSVRNSTVLPYYQTENKVNGQNHIISEPRHRRW